MNFIFFIVRFINLSEAMSELRNRSVSLNETAEEKEKKAKGRQILFENKVVV